MKQIYPKPEMECFPRQSAGPLRAHGGFPYEELGGHVVVTSPCHEDAVRIRNAAVRWGVVDGYPLLWLGTPLWEKPLQKRKERPS